MSNNANKLNEVNGVNELLITENPLNILDDIYYKPNEVKKVAPKVSNYGREDDYYISMLFKHNDRKHEEKRKEEKNIFKKIQILSKKELKLVSRKYFKFPFAYDIENDDSRLYHRLRGELIQSLSFVYSNYKRFREPFMVKIGEDIVFFNKIVTASKSLANFFQRNEIAFKLNGDEIEVADTDISIVYDTIVNMEIGKGEYLPFILSEYEFENSISYHTKIEEGPIVRVGTQKEHSYFIYGPLYSLDYSMDYSKDGKIDIKYIS